MKDLIERLEKATGPSRDLDIQIGLEIAPPDSRLVDVWNDPKNHTLVSNATGLHYERGCGGSGGNVSVPHYTASIDAALTLVPEMWQAWGVHEEWTGWKTKADCIDRVVAIAFVRRGAHSYVQEDGKATTPAIALCIAALKARS